jgi:hypothetical protein
MMYIEGNFRAFSEANRDISLILDISPDDQRHLNLKSGLNNRELWNWLAEHVGVPLQEP